MEWKLFIKQSKMKGVGRAFSVSDEESDTPKLFTSNVCHEPGILGECRLDWQDWEFSVPPEERVRRLWMYMVWSPQLLVFITFDHPFYNFKLWFLNEWMIQPRLHWIMAKSHLAQVPLKQILRFDDKGFSLILSASPKPSSYWLKLTWKRSLILNIIWRFMNKPVS